jgi:UPF0042 nucleotide-binding protein
MMLKKIVSFGFRHAPPPEGPGVVVVDIRRMFRNPYRDLNLRHLRGTDAMVQREIMRTPEFLAKVGFLRAQISVPGMEIAYIGCTGGHHRSVFLAERLGMELGVPVEHRDIDRG